MVKLNRFKSAYCALFLFCSLATFAGSFTVLERVLISSQRVSRTHTQFTYSVVIENSGANATAVSAQVTSLAPETVIVDGTLDFGIVAAGAQKTSIDTFTLEHDRQVVFDPASLIFTFSSAQDHINTKPIANAGRDQTVAINDTVNLDGSASLDIDGDPLSFNWRFVQQPSTSQAILQNANKPNASFVVDKSGDYLLSLMVNDGHLDSALDMVLVTTGNSTPVANAGADQTVRQGDTVFLNGSGSSDVDGDNLLFSWSFLSLPANSQASLLNANTVNPKFIADEPGVYEALLVVNDGHSDSLADAVVVSTSNSIPVAHAGSDQAAFVSSSVMLDGSQSSDADYDALSFHWSIVYKPVGSHANLSDPTIIQPLIGIDVQGIYIVQLIVNDGFSDSSADTVVISTENSRPIANAGEAKTTHIGEPFDLDGSLSTDADSDILSYQWAIISRPVGSTASLTQATSSSPKLITDKLGFYVLQLIVYDGQLSSIPDTLLVEAIAPEVILNVSVASGNAPLDVYFSATPLGGKAPYQYTWDLNGDNITDDVRKSFAYTYNQKGDYTVKLTMTDSNSYMATASILISVKSAPLVIASALPNAGRAPLDVVFSATTSDADGFIQRFEWDFESDGVIDYSSASSANAQHTYQVHGLFTARLTVFDNDGLSSSDAVAIIVGSAPDVTAVASVLSGVAPLSVDFSGTATDNDGTIVLYEWDFDGDRVFDYSNTDSASVTHAYTSGGIFNATLRVTDNDGLINVYSVIISVSGPPISLPGAYPLSGKVPLTVTFFSDGKDFDGGPEYYDWDFNGDGVYDRRLIASMNTTYTYQQPGIYQAALKVIDDDGLSSVATITITVTESTGLPLGSPLVTAVATPANGGAPLEVLLSGSASDPGGRVTLYEWDFESDGMFDRSEPATPVGLITEAVDIGSYSQPSFADFDADGDLDIVIGDSNGQITYFRNDGNSQFIKLTNLGLMKDSNNALIDVSTYAAPFAYDIDQDNDLDLLVGDSVGRVTIIENIGNAQNAVWQLKGFLMLSNNSVLDVGSYAVPRVYPIGNDTDWDLLIGNSNGQFILVENTGSIVAPVWVNQGALKDAANIILDVGSYATPWLIDHDNDGDLDIYSGESGGRLYFIENQGDSSDPAYMSKGFMTDSVGTTITAGGYSVPMVLQSSGSSIYDLWFGSSSGWLYLYQNTAAAPFAWRLRSNNFNLIDIGSYAALALMDHDHDGDQDLLVGNSIGQLMLIRNEGISTNPIWQPPELVSDSIGTVIDVGSYAAPAIYDLDNDGDQDMIVGDSLGLLTYYENTGTIMTPQWLLRGVIKNAANVNIDVGSYAHPVFYDIDGDGDADIYVGNSDGQILFVKNIGSASSANWSLSSSIRDAGNAIIDVGSYAAPIIADLNGDQVLELIVGNSGGALYQYGNTGSATAFSWVLLNTQFYSAAIGSYTSPIAINIDDDVDEDLIVGNSAGVIYVLPSLGNVKHIYATVGQYLATLRVTDDSGKSSEDTATVTVYPAGSPSLIVKTNTSQGIIPLTVNFQAITKDDGQITTYEWDFDGDGVFDFSGSQHETHTFNKVGAFNVQLRVTDNDGNQVSVAVPIQAFLNISASRTPVFNPASNEASIIGTLINAEAYITIQIVDEFGNVIRTLVNNQRRAAGSYSDSWNGTDALNNAVFDGAYYFVIRYSNNGIDELIDLRSTATFLEYTPNRTWPSTFNPYKGIPVTSTYTVNKPAEVSFYFWTRDNSRPGSTIAPIRTLFIRELKAAGSHTEIWDGVDDNGVPVNPGQQYPITLWVYELPDNVIIVTGSKPVISNLSVENRIFNPSFNPYNKDGIGKTRVNFNLSKDADIEVAVIDKSGLQINRFRKSNLTAGANSVSWDGRNFTDALVQQGVYSLEMIAVDRKGNRSLPRYAIVTVRY